MASQSNGAWRSGRHSARHLFLKQPRQAVWQLATSICAGISLRIFSRSLISQAIASSALGSSGSRARSPVIARGGRSWSATGADVSDCAHSKKSAAFLRKPRRSPPSRLSGVAGQTQRQRPSMVFLSNQALIALRYLPHGNRLHPCGHRQGVKISPLPTAPKLNGELTARVGSTGPGLRTDCAEWTRGMSSRFLLR
jgi:hypothetical protein